MQIWQTIKLAFSALGSNKTRSALTLLAIVVGVFAVISASTAVRVIDDYFQNTMTLLGSEVISISTQPSVITGSNQAYRSREPITFRQFEQFRDQAELARSISPDVVFRRTRISFEENTTDPNVLVRGGNEYSLSNNAYVISEGRNLIREDVEDARSFVIIGADVYKDLFERREAIGQRIRIDGQFYTVIGIVEAKGSAFGQSLDNFVMIPYTRLALVYGRERNLTLQIKAPSIMMINETIDEATGLLRTIRRVPPGQDNDFEIETNESLRGVFNDFTGVLYLFGIIVGGIALFGAGIGVMNIMLVSVTERTREIGIRKAVGANRRHIIHQFLAEAVIVCQLGGIIGIIMGVMGGNLLVFLMETSFVFPLVAVIFGIIAITVIGIVFGVYPAWKASKLDPIESLRFE
ncbi:ABC transporter permease [Balneolaceae bacterium ANBcel3]|nr:ABC transporter permease [Balneolaceae bacterium ANBcel3]